MLNIVHRDQGGEENGGESGWSFTHFSMHTCTCMRSTPSFPVYRVYLKILVFPFYKAQFGCFPSHVQIPRCIKSLHASIERKLTNACTLCMHALQLML